MGSDHLKFDKKGCSVVFDSSITGVDR